MVQQARQKPFDFDFKAAGIDVAFIALHGSYGEDGRIQGFLDTCGIPYTGCGVLASSLTMDKALTKLCAADAGLVVAPSITLFSADYHADPEAAHKEIEKQFEYPFFVKPANLGSSVGISKVHSTEALKMWWLGSGRKCAAPRAGEGTAIGKWERPPGGGTKKFSQVDACGRERAPIVMTRAREKDKET